MKITPQTDNLASVLELVGRAVKPRSTTPILSSVLFEAYKETSTLKVSATDTEITVSVRAQAPIEESGRSAIRAGVLASVVKSLSGEVAELSANDSEATLTTRQGSYAIHTYKAEDFPKLPEFPDGEGSRFTVPAKALAQSIEKVLPFASKDDSRPVLTGVLVSFEGSKLTMVGTDSYRMSVVQTDLPGAPKERVERIIPARGLKEVARLAELTDEIRVAITENAAMFEARGALISTRLIDGNYPEYQRLMPSGFDKVFSVNRGQLLASLRRVNLFCGASNPPAPVRLSFASGEGSLTGGELTLSAASEDMGQAVERVPASVGDEQSGEFVAAFNPQYLTSAVAAAGTEDVLFKFNDPLKPAMVFPDGAPEGSPSVQLLLMPMRDPTRKEKEEKQPAKKEDSQPQETTPAPEPVGAGSKG